ncbi:MAG TPA: diguanylate cyclase [Xanthomonadaceae bacterium]|nr:diguanylate cyclase [Xanthomonadaceae bacterium]
MTPTLPPLAEVLDLVPDAVCVVDAEGRYLFVNGSFERVFGYRPDEVLGRNMIELVHPDDRGATLEAASRVMEGRLQRHFRNRYVHKDGHTVDIQWSARWSPRDRVRIAVGHEVTELRRAEEAQAALLAIAEAAHVETELPALFARIHGAIGNLLPVDNVHVALLEADGDSLSYPYWRHALEAPPGTRPLAADPLVAAVVAGGATVLDEPAGGQAGAPRALAVPLATARGVIGALVVRGAEQGLAWEESDRQRLEFVASQVAAACERSRHRHELEHLAAHDPLTGLANRYRLQAALEAAIAGAHARRGRFALVYLDLDGFKAANDALGHEAGDRVLREVAQRLRASLRHADLVARIGGDEFVVLLPACRDTAAAGAVVRKLHAALCPPIQWEDATITLRASTGVAIYPEDGCTPDALLRQADQAMYAAKRATGNDTAIA